MSFKSKKIHALVAIGLSTAGVVACKARVADGGGSSSAVKSLQTGTRGLTIALHQSAVTLCVGGFALNSPEVALAKNSIMLWLNTLKANTMPYVKDRSLLKGSSGEDPCVFAAKVNAVTAGTTNSCDVTLTYTGQSRPDTIVGDTPTVRSGTMGQASASGYDLNYSMLHEFGHAYGLADTYILSLGQAGNCQPGQPANSIMCNPYAYKALQNDDIQGLIRNYMNTWGSAFLDFKNPSSVCKDATAGTATTATTKLVDTTNLQKPPVVTTKPADTSSKSGSSCYCREGKWSDNSRVCGIWKGNNWLGADTNNPMQYIWSAGQWTCDANFCNTQLKSNDICDGPVQNYTQQNGTSLALVGDGDGSADDLKTKVSILAAALQADPASYPDQAIQFPSFFNPDSQYVLPELGTNVDATGHPANTVGSGSARHGNIANNCPDGIWQADASGVMACTNPQESCRLGLTKDDQGAFSCALFRNNLKFVASQTGVDASGNAVQNTASQGDLEMVLDDVPYPEKNCTILYFEARATVNGNLKAYLNQQGGGASPQSSDPAAAATPATKCAGGIFGGPDPSQFFAL